MRSAACTASASWLVAMAPGRRSFLTLPDCTPLLRATKDVLGRLRGPCVPWRLLATADESEGAGGGINSTADESEGAGGGINSTADESERAGGGINSTADESEGAGGGISSTADESEGAGGGINSTAGESKRAGGGISSTADESEGAGGGINSTADESERAGGGINSTADESECAGGGINSTADESEGAGGRINSTADESEGAGGGINSTADESEGAGGGINSTADESERAGGGINSTTDESEGAGGGINSTADESEGAGGINSSEKERGRPKLFTTGLHCKEKERSMEGFGIPSTATDSTLQHGAGPEQCIELLALMKRHLRHKSAFAQESLRRSKFGPVSPLRFSFGNDEILSNQDIYATFLAMFFSQLRHTLKTDSRLAGKISPSADSSHGDTSGPPDSALSRVERVGETDQDAMGA
ncbi:hypothetical protein NDU88_006281 [Pleurodeles waltl]|uniref:Uncharacterized protein n=1 Tax=Pleurodeles waltl TaxID=8319 RepID=A0AAV7MZY8_PLEWA|nr:hypothetical protein NDU88_006281 [Pleurodeles waltl]